MLQPVSKAPPSHNCQDAQVYLHNYFSTVFVLHQKSHNSLPTSETGNIQPQWQPCPEVKHQYPSQSSLIVLSGQSTTIDICFQMLSNSWISDTYYLFIHHRKLCIISEHQDTSNQFATSTSNQSDSVDNSCFIPLDLTQDMSITMLDDVWSTKLYSH
jgi:hypothetical protein